MLKPARKTWLLLALAAMVALAIFAPAPDEPVSPARDSAPARNAKGADAAPAARATKGATDAAGRTVFNELPERNALGASKVDLFGSQSWEPPLPKVVARPSGPPAPPPPPPMTYRFAGRLAQDGKEQLFVSKGDTPVAVKLGGTLDGYVVESISAGAIALVYPPLGHKEQIFVPPGIPGDAVAAAGPMVPFVAPPPSPGLAVPPLSPSLATPSKPQAGVARVQWDGPAQVKLGANFSVALRVDADQPVSGSPMQIRFDPSVLESIAVRPGKRFAAEAGRGFNYRINAEGSISVGATSASAANNDPEWLVLTFKPKKNGTQAEVRLTSLDLQGPGGRVLAHGGLTHFRTTVTP